MGVIGRSIIGALLGATAVTALAWQQQAPPPVSAEAQQQAPLAAGEARRTAVALAEMLEENYVSPDIAARYGAALRAKAEAGEYDRIAAAVELAKTLTADLQAVSPDNHLRVATGSGAGPRMMMVRRTPGSPPPVRQRPAGAPPAIEEARWLAPGIAYIRFNEFSGEPEVSARAAAFMAEHADAKTVIIDIRTHRGGGLAEMDAMLPYLYGAPTTLVTMDTRGSVARRLDGNPSGSSALRPVPAAGDIERREHFVIPHASEKRLFDADVLLLTSNVTASAAEHFALALKATGRATLIGEKTAGAGNFGSFRPIGERFSAFIPVGMTRHPKTGQRWEGGGIDPDVAVPAEQALVEALKRSGVAPEEAERLSASVRPTGPMRRPAPVLS